MIAIRLLYRLNKFLHRLAAGELGLDMYSIRAPVLVWDCSGLNKASIWPQAG
jgi:hypothetical protein